MALEVVVPKLGMTMEEATLLRWVVPDGNEVRKGELIFEAESEKISFEGEAEADGILRHVAQEGATIVAGGLLAYILGPGESVPSAPPPPPRMTQTEEPGKQSLTGPQNVPGNRILASPVARRLANELGVDLSLIAGTGPGGRIVEADIKSAAAPVSSPTNGQVAKRVAITGVRKRIADRMLESSRQAAQFTLYLEIDMSGATVLRRSKQDGTGQVATADLVIKACTNALKKHPRLNARIEGNHILELSEINIGFAVALSEGLVVPVVRSADLLDLAKIGVVRKDLAERARSGGLTVDDVSGATFTVTVLGLVDSFAPIINPPEAAILGVGRILDKPIVRNGEVLVRPMATLSLTVDHRLVDGEPAAKFLREVGRLLEQPDLLGA